MVFLYVFSEVAHRGVLFCTCLVKWFTVVVFLCMALVKWSIVVVFLYIFSKMVHGGLLFCCFVKFRWSLTLAKFLQRVL